MITAPGTGPPAKPYPITLATALFSFIYHLASYELGGEALVGCGMLESLLKVVTWKPRDEDEITVRKFSDLDHLHQREQYDTVSLS